MLKKIKQKIGHMRLQRIQKEREQYKANLQKYKEEKAAYEEELARERIDQGFRRKQETLRKKRASIRNQKFQKSKIGRFVNHAGKVGEKVVKSASQSVDNYNSRSNSSNSMGSVFGGGDVFGGSNDMFAPRNNRGRNKRKKKHNQDNTIFPL